jgi:hypothetical protein
MASGKTDTTTTTWIRLSYEGENLWLSQKKVERQAVTTHKASGIVNDANDWAIETIGNPQAHRRRLHGRAVGRGEPE